jgi:endonuclease/exonuclease/phosphatase (EEP) superfamily protein YafD
MRRVEGNLLGRVFLAKSQCEAGFRVSQVQLSGGDRAAYFARLLTKFFTLVALASITGLLLGMLGPYSWVLDLFSHLQIHYIVALAVSALALLALRHWRSAVLALAAALAACIPTFDYLPSETSASDAPGLKAISFNVWFRQRDQSAAVDYLEASGADVVVLQEISESQAMSISPRLRSYPHAYLRGADESDTVVFSKWPILSATTEKLSPDGVSAIRSVLDWRGQHITLIAVHLHWPIGPVSSRRRNAELEGLSRMAQPLDEPLIILGDMNVTPWSSHFKALTETFGLDDCAAGHGLNPTWPSHVLPIGIRIDHCLATTHWKTVRVWTGPHLGSDHRPMGVEMQLRDWSDEVTK